MILDLIDDYDELNEEQQQVAAIRAIAKDFYIFVERNLVIKEKMTKQLVPLSDVLNWEQKALIEQVVDDLRHGRPIRYIILKARQMGISTIIEALCYWWTSTHRYVTSVIIAHEKNAVGALYKMFRRYYEYSHPHFQPDRKYNTKQELVFDVSDEVKKQYQEEGMTPPGLQSEIKTMVAADGKGRADNINFFHGSEVAFWDDSADIVSSALQAVPMAPESFAFLESTANGIGGYFYDEWQLAKRDESQFKPLFFPWHMHHQEYELEATDETIGNLDEEEEMLYDLFEEEGYERWRWPRKIEWRRRKKKEFRTDPKKFYQEYPSTPEEAFLASGRPVFDIKMLQKMEKIAVDNAKKFPYRCGEIVKNSDPLAQDKFIFREQRRIGETDPSPLRVWWLPEKGRKYCIGVDVSEGIEIESSKGREPDFSVVEVIDAETLKTVARWRGYIDPDRLGEVVFDIGMFYNKALVGPEINNHGIATAAYLKNNFYRNLYMRESAEDDQFQVRTAKFGWATNKKTKPIMISRLQAVIREGAIIDLDITAIRELMSFVKKDDGSMAAQEGQHDDCVMAKAIALQMADWSPYNTEYAKENIHKPIKRNKNASNTTTPSLSNRDAPATNARATVREGVARRRAARAAHRRGRGRGEPDS